MIPNQYFSNSKYFELVRRGTGLLTGKYRLDRIKQITSINIILAARCKNTSIYDEDEVCDFLLSFAYKKILKEEDAASIIALLELGEYMILADILKEKYDIKTSDRELRKFILEKEDFYKVLRFFSSKIPNEIIKEIFILLKTNGITVNTEYYNALLNISSSNDIWNIYTEMRQLGILSNAATFTLLFNKCDNFEQAQKILFDFKKTKYSIRELRSSLIQMISLCSDFTIALNFFCELESSISIESNMLDDVLVENEIKKEKKRPLLKALPYLIKLSENEETALFYYNKAKDIAGKHTSFQIFYYYCRKIENDIDFKNFIVENIGFYEDQNKKNATEFTYFDIILNFIIQNKDNEEVLIFVLENMETYGYIPKSSHLISILAKYRHQGLINYCISHFRKVEIDKDLLKLSYFTSLINAINFDNAVIIFEIIKEKGYKVNEILYNALIKKAPNFDETYSIFLKMLNEGLLPDKFSFTPLFRKSSSIEIVFDIIQLCSEYKVSLDENFSQILRGIATNNPDEFSRVFLNRSKSLFLELNNQWFDILDIINRECSDIIVFDCEVIHIIPSRIFVQIENEPRKCSIYIGELTDDRLDNIKNFAYNGVKLHVGQKMKAQLKNIDEKNGLNLSIKKIKK